MQSQRMSYIRDFAGLCRPYRSMIAVCILLAALFQGLNLAYPYLAGQVMDRVIAVESGLPEAERLRILWLVGASMLAIALCTGISHFLRGNLLGKLMWRIIFDLRQQLNWHLQKLSLSFYSRHRTGRLVSRIINDINAASRLVSSGAINLLLDLVFLLATLAILWYISPLLTSLNVLIIPVYVFALLKLNPRIRKASKEVQRHVAVMSGSVQERLSGMSVIKSFTSEKQEHKLFTEDNETYTRKVLYRRNLNLFLSSTTITINQLCMGIVIVAGGYLAISGRLSPGRVLWFILLLRQVFAPLNRLAEVNIEIQQALGSMERVFDLLHVTPAIRNAPDAVKSISGDGRIEFQNVSFCYQENVPVLRNIDLEIQPGTKVAVIGPSGAGKSTLASLVPRLYDVTDGRILIDSTDIRNIHLKTLRQTIGIVQQDPFLFSTTIRENISYGRQDAGMEEITAAARAANVHDFIMGLPGKYDSPVGERGITLSGGEKQRVCLARTILKDPRILILDEATSSVDSESENLIQQAMVKLMKGRTCIIIAHRLSTIMDADLVVVIQEGRIAEQGTHRQLWQEGRLYARLLRQQFGPLLDLVEKSSNGELRGILC